MASQSCKTAGRRLKSIDCLCADSSSLRVWTRRGRMRCERAVPCKSTGTCMLVPAANQRYVDGVLRPYWYASGAMASGVEASGVCAAERVWRTALVEGMICSWALGEARTLRRRVLRPRFCMLVCLPMSWLVAEAHAVWFFFFCKAPFLGRFISRALLDRAQRGLWPGHFQPDADFSRPSLSLQLVILSRLCGLTHSDASPWLMPINASARW